MAQSDGQTSRYPDMATIKLNRLSEADSVKMNTDQTSRLLHTLIILQTNFKQKKSFFETVNVTVHTAYYTLQTKHYKLHTNHCTLISAKIHNAPSPWDVKTSLQLYCKLTKHIKLNN